jgi:phosphoglycerate kinase
VAVFLGMDNKLTMQQLNTIDLANKRVLIREDLNVPLDESGTITSDIRIRAALPTIQYALAQGAAVMLMSHLGRPAEGQFEAQYSLAPVATKLSELLGQDVSLISDWQAGVDCQPGQVVLLENVRFNQGEKSNDDKLAKAYADLCDVYVMDAFATAHRAQASTHGVAKFVDVACAGPLLTQEIDSLNNALQQAETPFVAIVGGSKVSSKLTVLKNLVDKVDQLIIGGGIANTFIAAAGYEVGASLYEPDLVEEASQLMQHAGDKIPLPVDVVVAKEFSADAVATIKSLNEIDSDDLILDVGPKTSAQYAAMLANAKTIVWNGPVGVFEMAPFEQGTKDLTHAIADSSAFTVAGGGDTLAAIDKYKVNEQISYISTGGGAFLELLEGKVLPAVSILQTKGS